jgi:hypothetical protein
LEQGSNISMQGNLAGLYTGKVWYAFDEIFCKFLTNKVKIKYLNKPVILYRKSMGIKNY